MDMQYTFQTYLGGAVTINATGMYVDYSSVKRRPYRDRERSRYWPYDQLEFPSDKCYSGRSKRAEGMFLRSEFNPYVLAPYTYFRLFASYLGGSGNDTGKRYCPGLTTAGY